MILTRQLHTMPYYTKPTYSVAILMKNYNVELLVAKEGFVLIYSYRLHKQLLIVKMLY